MLEKEKRKEKKNKEKENRNRYKRSIGNESIPEKNLVVVCGGSCRDIDFIANK